MIDIKIVKEFSVDSKNGALLEMGEYEKIVKCLNAAADSWENVRVKWETIHIANPSSQTLLYITTTEQAVFQLRQQAKNFESKILTIQATLAAVNDLEKNLESILNLENDTFGLPKIEDNVIFANFANPSKKEEN